jgi:hypothetical protein
MFCCASASQVPKEYRYVVNEVNGAAVPPSYPEIKSHLLLPLQLQRFPFTKPMTLILASRLAF